MVILCIVICEFMYGMFITEVNKWKTSLTFAFQLYSLFHPKDHQPVAADHPLGETYCTAEMHKVN